MQRQYATILPKKSLKKGSDVDSEQETHDHKKRRIGVTVACDRCRERKIRVRQPPPFPLSKYVAPKDPYTILEQVLDMPGIRHYVVLENVY